MRCRGELARRFALGVLATGSSLIPVTVVGEAGTIDGMDLLSSDIVLHDGIVIGEMHGTVEIPAAFAELVAREAANGRVLVAFELQTDTGELECPTGSLPLSWRSPIQDGRTSIAMQEAVCRIRDLQNAGNVEILYIDTRSSATPSYYSEAATRIAEMLGSDGRFDVFFALTGNFHSAKADGRFITYLRAHGLNILSVTASSIGGEAWNCVGGGAQPDCSRRPTRFDFCEDYSTPFGWSAEVRPGSPWDRCLVLSEVSASPPAVGHD